MEILLPLPLARKEVMSVEQALLHRRSVRDFLNRSVSLTELSQILWACYGLTSGSRDYKTTPSAGATYPLDIYVVVKENSVVLDNEKFVDAGVYRYVPERHSLTLVRGGDYSQSLMKACLGQRWVREAVFNIVIVAVFERTTSYYGERGERYVWIEVGHAAQNVYLEATALGLGCVAIGAYYDDIVADIIGLEEGVPAYILSIGVPRRRYETELLEVHRAIARNRAGMENISLTSNDQG